MRMILTLFIILLYQSSAFACMSDPTYVDFGNAKESISVSGQKIILRHTKRLELKKDSEFKLEPVESDSFGGLHLYYVTSLNKDAARSSESLITVSDDSKSIDIKMRLQALRKGGCSKGSVEYK